MMLTELPPALALASAKEDFQSTSHLSFDLLGLDDLPPPLDNELPLPLEDKLSFPLEDDETYLLENDPFDGLNNLDWPGDDTLPGPLNEEKLKERSSDVSVRVEYKVRTPPAKRRHRRRSKSVKTKKTASSVTDSCSIAISKDEVGILRLSKKVVVLKTRDESKPYHVKRIAGKSSFEHQSSHRNSPQIRRGIDFISKFVPTLGGNSTIDENYLLSHVFRFMEQQTAFARMRKSTKVTIGYLHTNEDLALISTKGLLSSPESLVDRQFGGGTYLSHHPHTGISRGKVGIMVAYLPGNMSRIVPNAMNTKHFDTVVRNQELYDSSTCGLRPLWHDEIVPKDGAQCLPLFFFQSGQQLTNRQYDALWQYHSRLQCLLDETFNCGVRNEAPTPILECNLPAIVHMPNLIRIAGFQTPGPTLEADSIWNQMLAYCGPTRAISNGPLQPIILPTNKVGLSPSGVMTVHFSKQVMSEKSTGTYVIVYEIFNGIQEDRHISPGTPFVGLKLRVYVPFCPLGVDLLKRLKWAWMFGFMFTVIPSLADDNEYEATPKVRNLQTTMVDGQGVTYACHRELSSLGVPVASELADCVRKL